MKLICWWNHRAPETKSGCLRRSCSHRDRGRRKEITCTWCHHRTSFLSKIRTKKPSFGNAFTRKLNFSAFERYWLLWIVSSKRFLKKSTLEVFQNQKRFQNLLFFPKICLFSPFAHDSSRPWQRKLFQNFRRSDNGSGNGSYSIHLGIVCFDDSPEVPTLGSFQGLSRPNHLVYVGWVFSSALINCWVFQH